MAPTLRSHLNTLFDGTSRLGITHVGDANTAASTTPFTEKELLDSVVSGGRLRISQLE